MKKTWTIALVVVLTLGCVMAFAACANREIVGVFEMEEISGTLEMNGRTTTLDKSLYEFYTIEFKNDGTVLMRAKGANTVNQTIETEGTWTMSGNTVKVKSTQNGLSVVEEMTYEDGVLTYTTKQSGGGVSIDMTLTLKKQADK